MPEIEYSQLEDQLRRSEEAYLRLQEEYDLLQHQNNEMVAELEVSKMPLDMIKKIVIYANNHSNKKREGKSEIDFEVWQRGITDPLKMQLGAMRSLLFRTEMDHATIKRPGFKRAPFFYYDFYSKKTVYTPGVMDLFGIKERETFDLPLKALARKFIHEDEREKLTIELKNGKMIKDYLLKTKSEILGELVVNAYPLLYGREPVGFGVFLYSANANKFTMGRSRIFSGAVEEVVNKLGSEFQVIRQNVNNRTY
ncbi:Uncharacterised protein [uncultured archaeon]|nr:Uncharacterised protein [uncultured archaeon]